MKEAEMKRRTELDTISVYCDSKVLTWSNGVLYGDSELKESAEKYTNNHLFVDFIPNLPPIPANYHDTEHIVNVIASLISFNPRRVLILEASEDTLDKLRNHPEDNVLLGSYMLSTIVE